VIADKMAAVHQNIQRILLAADRMAAPVLSTTCLGIQRGHPAMSVCAAVVAQAAVRPGIALITPESSSEEVRRALACRQIRLQRPCGVSPDEAVATRSFDVFFANPHTATIIRGLGPRRWLVFGAGFEYCLLSAAEGLRALDLRVSVLRDAFIPGARTTPETFRTTLERFAALGVEIIDSGDVLGCGAVP